MTEARGVGEFILLSFLLPLCNGDMITYDMVSCCCRFEGRESLFLLLFSLFGTLSMRAPG